MSNIREQRLKLYFEADGKCHYCGIKTIFPRGNILNNVPNVATIDHLNSRFDPKRYTPCTNGERRRVLSCYRCNQIRARLEEIAYFCEKDIFIVENGKIRIEKVKDMRAVNEAGDSICITRK